LKEWAPTQSGTGIFHVVKIIVGIDIAKNVFQVHAADRAGTTIYTKKPSRGQVLSFFVKQPPH
jgi:transposase